MYFLSYGQKKEVFIYKLVIPDTVEEKIQSVSPDRTVDYLYVPNVLSSRDPPVAREEA